MSDSPVARAAALPGQMPIHEALKVLAAARTDQVVIATMGAIREWARVSSHPLDFHYIPSAMGQGSSIGLGIALARPERRVIVLNGDGSTLMNLGTLVTIAAQAPWNYYLIVLDNGVYEITGGQLTAGSRFEAGSGRPARVDFPGLARAAGFPQAYRFNELEKWRAAGGILAQPGPVFISLEVAPVPGVGTPKSPGPMRERVAKLQAALRG